MQHIAATAAEASENPADEHIPNHGIEQPLVACGQAIIETGADRILSGLPAKVAARGVADGSDKVRTKLRHT